MRPKHFFKRDTLFSTLSFTVVTLFWVGSLLVNFFCYHRSKKNKQSQNGSPCNLPVYLVFVPTYFFFPFICTTIRLVYATPCCTESLL